jgi:hypothetical protein
MMRSLQINPQVSAHKILHGPYAWNHYPLTPLGCKAVVYKDGDTHGLWALQVIDGLYRGQLFDHYRCDLYYLYFIPETRAYPVSSSTKFFPQHCLPDLTPHQHFCALVVHFVECMQSAGNMTKGQRLLRLLQLHINIIFHPPSVIDEQRGNKAPREVEQRMINGSPIIMIPCITNALVLMEARNPTAKGALTNTPRLHRQAAQNNTPGIMRFVVVSVAEVELGALYHNCQTGIIFCDILNNMGHLQPMTPVHCNNITAFGIASNTVKRQHLQSMEMRFFWVGDQVAQDMYALIWHPGKKILPITKVSTTLGFTILQHGLGTCI